MIYYISDLHFGHKRVIEMDSRPFTSIGEDDVYQFMSRFDHALNAGCMLNGYRPVTLDELIENNRLFRQEEKMEKT